MLGDPFSPRCPVPPGLGAAACPAWCLKSQAWGSWAGPAPCQSLLGLAAHQRAEGLSWPQAALWPGTEMNVHLTRVSRGMLTPLDTGGSAWCRQGGAQRDHPVLLPVTSIPVLCPMQDFVLSPGCLQKGLEVPVGHSADCRFWEKRQACPAAMFPRSAECTDAACTPPTGAAVAGGSGHLPGVVPAPNWTGPTSGLEEPPQGRGTPCLATLQWLKDLG